MDLNNYYAVPPENYLQGEKEKKEIKYIGRVAGCCILGYILLQNLLFTLVYISPFGSLYYSDPTFESVVNIFLSIFSMLIPSALAVILSANAQRRMFLILKSPSALP